MTLPRLATVDDLGDLLGTTIPDGLVARAEGVLDDASAMVRAGAGQTWVDPVTGLLTNPPGEIVALTKRIAARLWTNPTSVTQRTAGPFSESLGTLIDDDDRAVLDGYRPTSGLGTISTTRGCLETPPVRECDDWWEVLS
jgi:hypothetical protein